MFYAFSPSNSERRVFCYLATYILAPTVVSNDGGGGEWTRAVVSNG